MTTVPENTGRKQDTRFKPGVSGNPAGKPKGARHRATLAVEALMDGEAEALTRKAIELALEGNGPALRLCMDRIAPARKDRHVTFALPKLETAADSVKASAALVEAVADGELTPTEAAELQKLVDGFTRAVEATDTACRRAIAQTRRPRRSPTDDSGRPFRGWRLGWRPESRKPLYGLVGNLRAMQPYSAETS
jgi:hypothetical protein